MKNGVKSDTTGNGITENDITENNAAGNNHTENNATGNGITELVFILDRSGSMQGLEGDTIGGFNGLIEKQRRQSGTVYVSTVLFDSRCQVLHDRIPLEQVAPMTADDYAVGGCTALLDALGGAIHHIGNIHKYARASDVPEHTLFVITTDGMENASHTYSGGQVKKMIRRQQEKYGWEFLFLAANIDAVETARQYGIAPERAVDYHADAQGTAAVYGAVAKAMCCVRSGAALEDDWCESVREDYQNRKPRNRGR